MECLLLISRSFAVLSFALFVFFSTAPLWPQARLPEQRSSPVLQTRNQPPANTPDPASPAVLSDPQASSSKPQAQTSTLPEAPVPGDQKTDQKSEGYNLKQTHRILGVVPNFSSVSANTELPPLTPGGKFKLALSDGFDYSAFIQVGLVSAESLWVNSYPELGSGAAGYGRYYWRGFVDQLSGTYFTEAIVPTLTHEDPRYYSLGGSGFFRRTGYALSRSVITRKDHGGETFNISEIGGDALEAGLANAYYPEQERGARKTAESWATQVVVTSAAQVLKEFWPDIRHNILRQN